MAQYFFIERDDLNLAIAPKIPGIILDEAIHHDLQLRCGRRMLHPWFKLDERQPVIMRIRCRQVAGTYTSESPQVKRGAAIPITRIENMIELDGLPDDIPIPAELFLPEQIAQYRDGRDATARRIGRSKAAPHNRRYAHVREQIGRVLSYVYGDRELAPS